MYIFLIAYFIFIEGNNISFFCFENELME